MQLRDHPLMIRKTGHATWPPKWIALRPGDNDNPMGEVGGLEDVDTHALIENKIFLFMRYRGFRYMGVVTLDDPMFCRHIFPLLRSKIGLSIKEIGDLDLSFTP